MGSTHLHTQVPTNLMYFLMYIENWEVISMKLYKCVFGTVCDSCWQSQMRKPLAIILITHHARGSPNTIKLVAILIILQ